MAILTTGNTFANGNQVTATTLNNSVNNAVFDSGAVDGTSTQLSSGAIIVKDLGITTGKLASASVTTAKIANGNVTSDKILASNITTALIADSNVTKAKIENLANLTVLGNVSGSSAAPAEVFILDQDDMSSDSATAIATQQSIKAYVDSQSGSGTLGIAGGSGTGTVNLSTQTFTLAGTTNEIETTASGQTITIGLPSSITANVTGNLTGNVTGNITGTVNASSVLASGVAATTQTSGDNSTKVATTAYVDSQVSATGGWSLGADTGTNHAILPGELVDFVGTTNEIETSVSGNTLTIGLPSSISVNVTGNLTGNVTGNASTATALQTARTIAGVSFDGTSNISLDTGDITEGSNEYFTTARARSSISASGDISYNSSTGVISFTASGSPVTSVNTQTGAVVLDTDDIAEAANLYYTSARANSAIDARVTQSFVNALNIEAASVSANSVALGTDTTGNYVASIATGSGLDGSSSSEGGAATISLDLNELSTSTTSTDGDYFVVVDSVGNQRKLTKGNISIAGFNTTNGIALATDTTGPYVAAGATAGDGISGSVSSEGGTFTVTSNATNSNVGSTIVYRDASGNFDAGTISAALTGNVTGNVTSTGTSTFSDIDVTSDLGISTNGDSNTSKAIVINSSGTDFESDAGMIQGTHAGGGSLTGGYWLKLKSGGAEKFTIKGNGDTSIAGDLAQNRTGSGGFPGYSADGTGGTFGTVLEDGGTNGSSLYIARKNSWAMYLATDTALNAQSDKVVQFADLNGQTSDQANVVGNITITSSSVALNSVSDYRLKENAVDITDGIDRLNQLKPYRFNFTRDPSTTVDGFFAHEVSPVVPESINGDKDAVDEEGRPDYQGIDQSKLVPLLTAALQEAVAKIEALEARVATLEG